MTAGEIHVSRCIDHYKEPGGAYETERALEETRVTARYTQVTQGKRASSCQGRWRKYGDHIHDNGIHGRGLPDLQLVVRVSSMMRTQSIGRAVTLVGGRHRVIARGDARRSGTTRSGGADLVAGVLDAR